MRLDLKNILQERFHGHEAEVDPGMWDAIRSQITSAPASDPVEDLFRKRFEQHEVHVDNSAWNAINAQIGQDIVSGGASSGSGILGWAAAGLGAIALTAGLYLYTTLNDLPQGDAPLNVVEQVGNSLVEPVEPTNIQSPMITDTELALEAAAEVRPAPKSIASAGEPAALNEKKVAGAVVPKETEEPGRISPPERMEIRDPMDRLNNAPTLPEGTHVVKDVIQQMKGAIHQEAIAAGPVDPKGPPAVERHVAEEEVLSEVERSNAIQSSLPDIFMPNTFTPNGDGINDSYYLERVGFKSMMIRIYSLQNNTLVFSTDTNEEWDGANCVKGYYLVAVEAITDDGRLVTKGKAVWLNNDRY